MAVTLAQQTYDSLHRFARERRIELRPDDPIGASLQSVIGNVGSMGGYINRLERENRLLKEEIERLKKGR